MERPTLDEEGLVRYEVFALPNENCSALLDKIRARALTLTSGYIWNKDDFSLRISNSGKEAVNYLVREIWRNSFTILLSKGDVSCLSGATDVAGNVDDEWLIVWILSAITKEFPGTAAR